MSSVQTTKRAGTLRKQKRFPFFLLLSCLIHATLIILIAFLFARHFTLKPAEQEPPPPEVTLEITPPEKKERPFIEAKEVADKAPEQTPFQSDENTKAASELPPEGSSPLPSQQGVEQSALELQNQRHTAGEQPASTGGKPVKPSQPIPPTPPSPPTPTQPPKTAAATPTPAPTPSPLPSPTPPPSPLASPFPTSTPPPNNLKLLEPPKPEQVEKQPQKTSTTLPSQQSPSRPTSPEGTQGTKKGYQPETRQTVIRGNISNRGRSSVAAEATPIGRYKKSVADAIGSRWYYYVKERMGLLSIGTVDVSFKVAPSGKVTGLHVVHSNSNESLTDCSLRSIMDAKLPPIPADVARTLQDGCLEIDYSFTIY
jgi:outer membrane biosynthesis protein TonB